LASAGIRGEYKGRNYALRMVAKSGKLLTKPLPATTQRKLKRKVYQTIGSDMLVAEHLQETFKKVISDDVRPDAAKLKLPTLLVYGDNDEQAPLRYGEIFSRLIPGSKLEMMSGGGHFVHLDRPAETIGLVEEFLS
ncbi:MAG: alpha/beta fold hydrolase, partial [Candidatus Saccharimonadales bacterium]